RDVFHRRGVAREHARRRSVRHHERLRPRGTDVTAQELLHGAHGLVLRYHGIGGMGDARSPAQRAPHAKHHERQQRQRQQDFEQGEPVLARRTLHSSVSRCGAACARWVDNRSTRPAPYCTVASSWYRSMPAACAIIAPPCCSGTAAAAFCAGLGNMCTFSVQRMPSSKLPSVLASFNGAISPCSANRLCACSTAASSAVARAAFCADLPSALSAIANAIASSAIAASTSIRVKPRGRVLIAPLRC